MMSANNKPIDYKQIGNLKVSPPFYDFIISEALPNTEVEADQFWSGFEAIIEEFAPENKSLLERRDYLQEQIHTWHKKNNGAQDNQEFDFEKYKQFLNEIGYLESEPASFTINTTRVDDEIAVQAGPQLVVPVDNARYALNAANARWGSLYDALYGTDVISEDDGAEQSSAFNPVRGEKVVTYSKTFLDQAVPLTDKSHGDVAQYAVIDGQLHVTLENSLISHLKDATQLVGYQGEAANPSSILLKNNNLHIDIQIDREHAIGRTDKAGVKDIVLESALTTIMDCEDSVAAVDTEDKVLVYRNWLGLMNGTLTSTFSKGKQTVTRSLNADREYTSLSADQLTIRGRSLMFIRNVGHLMTSNIVLDQHGQEIPEGILDTVVTSLIAKHDLLNKGSFQNSHQGSVYIVKPKMHGSEEVSFANRLFNRVEDLLGLDRHTLKIGVMDEERRTSLNLKACIYAVKDRIAFINTGFLDRTGDEMHTSMEAGVMIRKGDMKTSTWLQAYEQSNVATGLCAGFKGRAQIGKGMWAMPDLMEDMLTQKVGQLKAGANTAWVPSPTAATLHALHYHQVNVASVQNELEHGAANDYKDEILNIPIDHQPAWNHDDVQNELNNNAQGILGYVVRWVEHGVGCSKVPDIHHVALMEDRATLRISSQHMANWLHHGICTEEQIMETMKRMAKIVDEQNADDPNYRNMSANFEQSIAFQAACDLVFKGYDQPNGYTEPILHSSRQEFKAK